MPVAGAIAVFGAASRPVLGPGLTAAASAVVFSGAAQFTMVGMLAAASGPWAVLGAVGVLNLRHLVLGALIRPRLEDGVLGRAGRAWFLIDETVGLALASDRPPGRTLVTTGLLCYGAWVGGTALGVAGAGLPGLEGMARALFPVLFIGLAALMATGRGLALRALAAALATFALLVTWPGSAGVAPLVAALAAALPRGSR